MPYFLFVFKSLTITQKCQHLLSSFRYNVTITRLPDSLRLEGCGYGLKVPESKGKTCLTILKGRNLRPERVYHSSALSLGNEVYF